MSSYLPAADYATPGSAGPLPTGMPAGLVAFRAADLAVLPAVRRGAVLAVPAGAAVTAGTMVTFCQPVVTIAPAVVAGRRGAGRRLAARFRAARRAGTAPG